MTETDLIRLLSNTPLQVEIDLLMTSNHISKNTPIEHIKTFYKDFSEIEAQNYDGMIITGAPVEQMEFEEVNYWDEITSIFDWARTLYVVYLLGGTSRVVPFLRHSQISVTGQNVRYLPAYGNR